MSPVSRVLKIRVGSLWRLVLADGRIVELRLSDGVVTAHHEGVVGRFEFEPRELEQSRHESKTYNKLVYMNLESGFRRCGIGTQAVELWLESDGTPLAVSDRDGGPSDDGSHLEGDGIPFAAFLIKRYGAIEL